MPDAVSTVRIPELPQATAADGEYPLDLADEFAFTSSIDNITRKANFNLLRILFDSGGSSPAQPINQGNKIYHKITAAEAGLGEEKILSISELAGKNYNVRRDGKDLVQGETYQNRSSGGLELLIAGDYLIEGQLYVFELFDLASGPPGTGTGGGSLFSGIIRVDSNRTINPSSDVNKIHQLRGGANQLVLTLPDVSLVPDNCIIPIESSITNDKQSRIATSGGQYIYLNNASYNSLYIAPGEVIWLYPGDDGWYLLNDFGSVYRKVGKINTSYSIGMNELLLDGSVVNRSDYPRLWEVVQSFGSSLVSEAVWQITSVAQAGRSVPFPYRGCFSTGNGTSTFRLPDYRDMGIRMVKSVLGADPERYLNRPGGYQRDEFESHTHQVKPPDAGSDEGYGKTVTSSAPPENTGINAYSTQATGGTETRMKNIGVLFTINV